MKIAITGSTGFIGSALVAELRAKGHDILRLVRHAPGANEVAWDPDGGAVDAASLEGIDAAIHLAGENIAGGRWTARRKRRIRESRVRGTSALAKALAALNRKPRALIAASAVGIYGDRGEEPLTEASEPGCGFLADVCREWESAAGPAREAGIRVVHTRFGMVIGPNGGALAKMLPAFRLGLGGIVGNGRQYVSWIALDDLVAVIARLLDDLPLAGALNVVSPEPVPAREFTQTLARALRKPAVFRMPGFAARLVFGEMADETLLASARALPARLQEAGFVFRYPRLEDALRGAIEAESGASHAA